MIAFSACDYPVTTYDSYDDRPTTSVIIGTYHVHDYWYGYAITGNKRNVLKSYYGFLPKRVVPAKLRKCSVQGNGIKGQQRTTMVRG